MAGQPVRLKFLLHQRHWQTYRIFCREYDKVARAVEPGLVGTAPSRAQLYRWLAGDLKSLPYPDHCRILEQMFPGWTAEQLFERSRSVTDVVLHDGSHSSEGDYLRELAANRLPSRLGNVEGGNETAGLQLVTSGGELTAALIDVVHNARECFVAVGSRSRAPAYLSEVERAFETRPNLVHYRILIGLPHSQVLKDHLVRLLEIRDARSDRDGRKTLHIGLLDDLTRDHERFYVASERSAVISLPSANSPRNFDTGLIVHNASYARGLVQHGKALYGRRRLESLQEIAELEVLE